LNGSEKWKLFREEKRKSEEKRKGIKNFFFLRLLNINKGLADYIAKKKQKNKKTFFHVQCYVEEEKC
jgi:hypothetical protein